MLCYSVWILTELAPWQPRLNGGQQRIMETSKSEFMAGIMYRAYCLRPLWCLTPFYLFILTARVFSWYWRCRRELRKRIKETKQKSQKGHWCGCEKFFPPLKWLSMVVICRCAKTCALWIRPDYSVHLVLSLGCNPWGIFCLGEEGFSPNPLIELRCFPLVQVTHCTPVLCFKRKSTKKCIP